MSERYNISDTAPTPRQMKLLSGIVMRAANDRGKLRPSQKVDKAYGFIDETDLLQDHREGPYSLRHRLSVRMARLLLPVPAGSYSVGAQEWSMKLADTRYYEHDDNEWIGSRSMMRFAWNEDEVLQAVRSTQVVPSEDFEVEDINDEISRANTQINSPDFFTLLDVQNQYQQLTADDIDAVIDQVDEYLQYSHR